MPPKRKAAEAAAPVSKRSSRATAVVQVEEPKAKGKAKAEPKKAAKVEPKKAAKAAPKKGKGSGPDPEEFVDKLLEVCKVLITVCKATVDEDEKKGTITTTEDFATYGKALLALLPEDARLPMMKMAHVYQEAINELPLDFDEDDLDEGDSDDEDDEDEDDEDDDEDALGLEDDLMLPEHFYQFKQYFTPAMATTFMTKADDAMESALDKMVGVLEQSDVAAAAAEDDDEEEDDDEDFDWTDDRVPWKGE
jgi:hypothetical protein